MKIEVNEDEIVCAIIEYVGNQGLPIDPAHAEVDLKAGRGENGMTATISVIRPEDRSNTNVTLIADGAPVEALDASEEDSEDTEDNQSIFNT